MRALFAPPAAELRHLCWACRGALPTPVLQRCALMLSLEVKTALPYERGRGAASAARSTSPRRRATCTCRSTRPPACSPRRRAPSPAAAADAAAAAAAASARAPAAAPPPAAPDDALLRAPHAPAARALLGMVGMEAPPLGLAIALVGAARTFRRVIRPRVSGRRRTRPPSLSFFVSRARRGARARAPSPAPRRPTPVSKDPRGDDGTAASARRAPRGCASATRRATSRRAAARRRAGRS